MGVKLEKNPLPYFFSVLIETERRNFSNVHQTVEETFRRRKSTIVEKWGTLENNVTKNCKDIVFDENVFDVLSTRNREIRNFVN